MKNFHDTIVVQERLYMQRVLRKTGDNVSKAIEISGLSRSQFYRVLDRVGIELPKYGTDERPGVGRRHDEHESFHD